MKKKKITSQLLVSHFHKKWQADARLRWSIIYREYLGVQQIVMNVQNTNLSIVHIVYMYNLYM